MIELLVQAFALTLARVGTFVYFLPLLGGPNLPRMVKVGTSMALSVFFYVETASALLGSEPGTTATPPWLGFGVALVRELFLGALLGFAMGLFLMPARVAGEMLAQESGLTIGNILSATGDGVGNPFVILFEMIASLVFFTLDFHHVFLTVLHATFTRYPIGRAFALPTLDVVTAVGAAEEGGLLLAAPLVLCVFLTTVVLMMMARAAPQLNLFSVGLPLRVLVSLGVILVLLPQMVEGICGQFAYLVDVMRLRG